MEKLVAQRTLWALGIAAYMTVAGHAIDTDALPYLDTRAQEAMVLVRTPSGEGSGFVVGYDAAVQSAYILSAQHVIAGDDGDVTIVFFDGRESRAQLIRQSAGKDICVMAARRVRAPAVLELDAGLTPLEPLQPVVVVGRDDEGVKQHVGAYLEEPGLPDVGVEGRRISASAFSLPGFSGGAMTARTDAGQVVAVGMLTHGSPEISTGPDAAELTAFLAEADVRIGLSAPGADIVADDDLLDEPPDWHRDDGEAFDAESDLEPSDVADDAFLAGQFDARSLVDEAFADAGWPLSPTRPPAGNAQRPPVRVTDGPRRSRVHREVIVVPGSGVRIVIESVIQ